MAGLWVAGWLVASGVCFALPMWPAWRELRRPRDAQALRIQPEHTGTVDFRALELSATVADLNRLSRYGDLGDMPNGWIRLMAAQPSLEAKTARNVRVAAPVITSLISEGDVHLEGGVQVRKLLQARQVYCHTGARLGLFTSAKAQLHMEPRVTFTKLSAASIVTVPSGGGVQNLYVRAVTVPPLTQSHVRHANPMVLGHGDRMVGSHVIRGGLSTGQQACLDGHVKVHGPVQLGRGTVVTGNVFVQGNVFCEPDVLIGGALSATGTITLSEGVQVGAPSQFSSVMAERVLLSPLVQVFGSVSAQMRGMVLSQPLETAQVAKV